MSFNTNLAYYKFESGIMVYSASLIIYIHLQKFLTVLKQRVEDYMYKYIIYVHVHGECTTN